MALHPTHRRFLWFDQGVVGFVINVAINYGIARVIFGPFEVVPLLGDPSMVTDTVVTAFVLPFLVALIVGWITRAQVKQGKLPVPDWTRAERRWLSKLPQHTGRRALVLGAIGVVAIGFPLTQALVTAFPEGLAPRPWCWLKGGIAGVLAVWVGPVAALATLGDLGGEGGTPQT